MRAVVFCTTIAALIIWSVSCTFAWGCYPVAEQDSFGRAYRIAKSNQILNPSAGANLNPVEGLDGAAAEIIIGAYHQSFQREDKGAKTNVFQLNLPGGGTK